MKTINDITVFQTVKVTVENYWLLKLIYGDAADDQTAVFQIPANVKILKTVKIYENNKTD